MLQTKDPKGFRSQVTELQEQLAALRERMARARENCDQKHEKPPPAAVFRGEAHADDFSIETLPVLERPPATSDHGRDPARFHVEEWFPGEEVETGYGKHFESETFYPGHRQHGSADIGALREIPATILDAISNGAIASVPPHRWVFLDTETTGLAGGTGTCAFLVGVGRITDDGFRVRQFFMRDHGEEASLLDALTRHLEPYQVLITYNGRTFDQPLLETRYRLNRARPPFSKLEHLDLLHGARRLWKLRFESCRLVELERQVLGFERQGDVPGAMIPYIYFEYLRSGEMARLMPVFHHNALDILTLACLTGIVPHAFSDPANAPLRHGAELAGIGRWLLNSGELEQTRIIFRRAIKAGLPDNLLFKTLFDLAGLERKLDATDAALEVWNDLAACKNAFRVKALEELAKHHEHHSKDYAQALNATQKAIALENSAALRKREERLLKKTVKAAKNGQSA